jgi:hypothetical protein
MKTSPTRWPTSASSGRDTRATSDQTSTPSGRRRRSAGRCPSGLRRAWRVGGVTSTGVTKSGSGARPTRRRRAAWRSTCPSSTPRRQSQGAPCGPARTCRARSRRGSTLPSVNRQAQPARGISGRRVRPRVGDPFAWGVARTCPHLSPEGARLHLFAGPASAAELSALGPGVDGGGAGVGWGSPLRGWLADD